jgi:hypothetical protein
VKTTEAAAPGTSERSDEQTVSAPSVALRDFTAVRVARTVAKVAAPEPRVTDVAPERPPATSAPPHAVASYAVSATVDDESVVRTFPLES